MGSSSDMDPRTESHAPDHGDDTRPATPLALDARVPRPARLLTSTPGPVDLASVDLTAVMTAASNPVSPGPATPPSVPDRAHDFAPPTRPSSTPFPQPELRTDELRCPGYSDGGADVDACSGNASRDEGMLLDVQEGELAGLVDPHPPPPVDMMELDILRPDGAPHMDCVQLASAGLPAEPPNLSSSMSVSAVPTTPSLSPISTVATFLDSPDSHFDAYVAYPLGKLDSLHDVRDVNDANNADDIGDIGNRGAADPGKPASTPQQPRTQSLFLQDLPMEIQELILDHVFDGHVSPLAKSWPDKRLTKLASFTRVWRTLIQQRLYCRIKLKATGLVLSSTLAHFERHPHLRSYVKHVELWFPVFQPKSAPPALLSASTAPTVTLDGLSNATYTLPSNNCSLEEAFSVLGRTFPELSILTLEGGERKKAPRVRHFTHDGSVSADPWWAAPTPTPRAPLGDDSSRPASPPTPPMPTSPASASSLFPRPVRRLPPIQTVRTLICKGQWNLIRSEADFQNIVHALPHLHDWQASYSKPKSKSYLTMATILPKIPAHLTSLDLCLEGDYRQEISFPPYFLKVIDKVHFCTNLAEATPALQHLSYTGRVCRTFFDVAACLADPRATRLRSVDLTVKNCCRHVNHWHESGSGVTDLNFIRAFESLVLSAVRALAPLSKLEHLRIRYVDLEFPVPPLNPFFLLHEGRASGVWSDTIVAELNRVRPDVCWEELSESIGERTLSKDGRLIINAEFPKKRVMSLKLSNYAFLVALATI